MFDRLQQFILTSPNQVAVGLTITSLLFAGLVTYLLPTLGRWLKKRKEGKEAKAKPVQVDQDLARRVGQLEDRITRLERIPAGRSLQLQHVGLPASDSLQPGMVLVWNGTAWVGHPTQIERQPIVRKSRGRGKKREVVLDQLPTAWDRIQEDDDDGTNQT